MKEIDPKYRVENDSMGSVLVPVKALYGAQTQRAVENFQITGRKPWQAFIWSLAMIKKCAAITNFECGTLDEEKTRAIAQAASEIISGLWQDQFVVDPIQAGAGTSHNMNMNEVIASLANGLLQGKPGQGSIHPNDHVNMSQSTNDTIPAAIRLGCLWRHNDLLNIISNLVSVLREKAIEFDDVVKSGRTHLQDAVPLRLGQEFGGYATAVHLDLERIRLAGNQLGRLGLGGTATGTGLNAPVNFSRVILTHLVQETGFPLVLSNDLFESMQSTSDIVNYSAAFRTLAITLIRIANDIRLLASGPATGFDEIRLPPVQPGSSIMPGKVNPVIAEMLNMAMFKVIGCDTTIALAAQAGQLELNVMLPIIADSIFEMMQIMINSIQVFTKKCITGITVNREKAEASLSRNPILITVLNPIIGYDAAAEIVKSASETGETIQEIAARKANQGELTRLGTLDKVTKEEIDNAFRNLRRFTEGGIIQG